MINPEVLELFLNNDEAGFYPVVEFDAATQKIAKLNLSPTNLNFGFKDFESTAVLNNFIENEKAKTGATYLIGGYNEFRNMYLRSALFDTNVKPDIVEAEEPRNIHLGIDIWGPVNTKIYAPLGGVVHSFAFNDHFGDYGTTIILQHQLNSYTFYTLYGHLALRDIENLKIGQEISHGEHFAHFGAPNENGDWPPHLHFQIILDIGDKEGDYPGVCKQSEAVFYLHNCPNPDAVLKLNRYL